MHYVVFAKNSCFYLGMSNESNIVTIESVDIEKLENKKQNKA